LRFCGYVGVPTSALGSIAIDFWSPLALSCAFLRQRQTHSLHFGTQLVFSTLAFVALFWSGLFLSSSQ